MEESKLKTVRRGTDPQDGRWFSKEAVLKLQKAQEELEWMLNRGYNNKSVVNIIGNHYQFSLRQRNALTRSTSSQEKCSIREKKQIQLSDCRNKCLYIDGFNLIITLEAALSKGVLVLCNDNTLRDLAGLRGTYSVIDKTDFALELIGKKLDEANISKAEFFLDMNVSNSGRLKSFILKHAEKWTMDTEVELMQRVDSFLYEQERVVTSDSIILDNCESWVNLSMDIVEEYIRDVNIVDLSGRKTAFTSDPDNCEI
ncbi:hypothetical protein CPAST_c31280 [Clostridium pasteurianum DSM 525 = ATCC 6013]|uniref:DUF434 domain-containing protein n=1 Tax=Clostridium pasteurianum DSM 525 = ATCC 6013 TaxID=1262449 RepID=A0A0H3J6U9_CLOPA|nr:DUF434 domain-containing protein [Clostridium pasteurianum]AJA49194.1 hypothetical protein CPAST_c31280 [Clostridium pasteurianum DSM 525 = ATCC 6013]AJA53182.1 hypothetical protein CLPA_c31280 [Clostridium pasteurianum DSM 525 = ATCC 6013]AOZ76377.1 hypothetical protein AQ983_15175 [Clostridium pasteurianum DSM 525 = ATCC 6013]AOZ80174.1 hypothetical protein AQ984_15170 [Clostridium pasteurianum]ELP59126.1 hypothetical protein F502_11591 [Clostridium pasteurianum DSM 525 = ATCC 6013]